MVLNRHLDGKDLLGVAVQLARAAGLEDRIGSEQDFRP